MGAPPLTSILRDVSAFYQKEAQVQLALQALKQDANLSQQRAAAIYRVPQATLSYRHAGRPSRADTMPNSRGLDDNKERVIVNHILELDARGFGPQLADVAAIANSLQAKRNLGPAILPFIIFKARHHLSDWYKEEDLPQDWVIRVSNNGWTTNKLGLEWLKHFDRHTKERTVGTYRLLVIDGHESHKLLQFQQYCKDNKIVTLSRLPTLQSLSSCYALKQPTMHALEHYAKGGAILLHKLVLAQQQIAELQAANEAATQRKSHKRKRVQKEGTLIVEDGQRLAALKEFGARSDGKRAKKQTGHNVRTFCDREPKCGVLGHNGSGFGGGLAKVMRSPVESALMRSPVGTGGFQQYFAVLPSAAAKLIVLHAPAAVCNTKVATILTKYKEAKANCASRMPNYAEQALQQAAKVVKLTIKQGVAGLSTYIKQFICYYLRVVAASNKDLACQPSRRSGSPDSNADLSDKEQQNRESYQDPMRDSRELFLCSGYDEKAQVAKARTAENSTIPIPIRYRPEHYPVTEQTSTQQELVQQREDLAAFRQQIEERQTVVEHIREHLDVWKWLISLPDDPANDPNTVRTDSVKV
ncbi:hypothetical protein OPT61_g5799 [Boeremia exigua]|uniref:Uncharacterized protein n=1 Tax=Boeremia exigua TaxID=749465 RepID=A0ACC2I912_9PLEO|nr:hypothetical protein OPT61_g5799 [Boeremia exigua]